MEQMLNLDTWILALTFLLGTGWYGGGSSALHDHSDAISNGGPLGTGVVGTAQLRTATGSAATTVGDFHVIMNDYAYFPSVTNEGSITWDFHSCRLTADPGDTIGQFLVSSGNGTCTSRWRYETASDDPRIWIIADATGTILSVWCADDPTGDDVAPPIALIPMPVGATITRLVAADLDGLGLPQTAQTFAAAMIVAEGMKPKHLLYRTLQIHTDDAAPARWILKNCQLDLAGRLTVKGAPLLDVVVAADLIQQLQEPTRSWLDRVRGFLGF
jgi:hypothetical protein